MSDKKEFKLTEEQENLKEKTIVDGQKIVFPERAEQWEDYVEDRFKKEYAGQDAVEALTIMKALYKGESLEEATKLLKSTEPNGKANGIVRKAVLLFADRGPEFWKSTSQGHISLRTRFQLFRIARENKRLKKVYSYMLPSGEEQEKKEEDNKPSWALGDDEMQIVQEKTSEIAKNAIENIQKNENQNKEVINTTKEQQEDNQR